MKKITLIIAFFIVAFSANAQRNAIKMGPIAFAFGNANFAYENQFADKLSFILKASYFYGFKVGDEKIDGFAVGGGLRFYFKQKKTLAGLYTQLQSKYSSAKAVSAALIFGYQWRWDGGLVLDVGIGPAKYFSLDDDISYSGVIPAITFGVGYAF